MFSYYIDFWKHYVDFNGRSTRSQWWYVCLINSIIISLLLMIPLTFIVVTGSTEGSLPFWIITFALYGVYSLAQFLPGLGLTIRRLRDAGFHWAFIFFSLIPYIGGFILLIFLCLPTKELEISSSKMKNEEVTDSKGEDK